MDTQLVTRAQQGDEAAFAELTVAVGGRLHRIAYSILRDRGLAEDATQQAHPAPFIRMFKTSRRSYYRARAQRR